MGDMLSNKELKTLPAPIRRGVEIHRAIDHNTDNHPSMREVVGLLRPQHRKYAPVVADILLDHVLVLNWDTYSKVVYREFEEWVYQTIISNIDTIPTHLHGRLQSMVKHRWLRQYDSLAGMQYVLDRMDRRARFSSNFGSAIQDFHAHYPAMQSALEVLYTDLSSVVLKMREED